MVVDVELRSFAVLTVYDHDDAPALRSAHIKQFQTFTAAAMPLRFTRRTFCGFYRAACNADAV